MKEYCSSEIFETPISSSVAYEGLNLGIEPFAGGVGDWIHAIVEKAIEVPFEHIRDLGQRSEFKSTDPASPVIEERQRLASVAIDPELRKGVLRGPRLGDLQAQVLHYLKHLPVVLVPGLRRTKEEILRTLEIVLPLAGKLLALGFSNTVHRPVKVLGDVKTIMHYNSFGSFRGSGAHECRPHVHRHRMDFSGVLSKRVEQRLGRFAVSILDHFEHPRFIQVGYYRGVSVASPKRLLVDAYALDRPIHNALELIVTQRKQDSGLLERAARADRFDGQSLEEQSESRARFGPGDPDRLHPTLGAIHSRSSADYHRFELHRVEVAPTALRSVVVNIAPSPAIRAARLLALGPINRNRNAAFAHAKIDLSHLPRLSKP